MPVANETNSISYAGDGVTAEFYFTGSSGFEIFEDADLLVIVKSSLNVETILSLNSDYTVTGAGTSSGYITLLDPTVCPSGSTVFIIGNIEATQNTEFVEGSDFSAAAVNRALDKLTRLIIQVQRKVSRAVLLPVTTPYENLTLAEPSVGKYPLWNAGLTGLENGDGSPGGTENDFIYIYSKTMTGDETFSAPGNQLMRAILDANGLDRTFNPLGTFAAGFVVEIWNVGNNAITFDSAGLDVSVAGGQIGRFIYAGSWFFGQSI
jgi:hypothetical protein